VQTDATADRIVLEIDYKKELLAYATSALSQGVVANHEARGLSGGRNTGVAAATGDLIAFIDDDAVIDASWLDIPVARCKGPGILGASGWINPRRVGLRPAWLPEEFLSAANSGFATVKFERHWAIARAMLRVGMAE
jgi:glycosyltransferase involved in cell wall biosynthesis